jgi:hypothetical protein
MKAYTFTELKQQRDEIRNKVLSKLNDDKILLRVLADNMAEAATHIRGQGYTNFLNARETFLFEIDRIAKDYSLFLCSDTCDVKPCKNSA